MVLAKEPIPYSVTWAAQQPALSCCEKTVYRLVQTGRLGCIRRPGASIRILPRHIEEYEARFEVAAISPAKDGSKAERQPSIDLTIGAKLKVRRKSRERK
ncbi:helix-turn-helix domain-containing protein [Hwanghaeella sp.]|uniref:helix-turn-helix domain-containing protein n=1 Tax=Hwanghaeella sp. TaxID=2605943 RepID=UPI003CCBDA25